MKLLCESWSVDGIISVLIYDEEQTYRYEYAVDVALIPGWRKRMQYQPGIVLNEIKRKATRVKKL